MTSLDPGAGEDPTRAGDSVDERQAYIDDIAARRGYVLDYHKLMAYHDVDLLAAADKLVHEAYLRPRSLDAKTKELLFILSLVVMRASKAHIQSHIKVALRLGVSAGEILEAIEIALPEAGVVAFQHGVEAWAETTNAPRLEPTSTSGDQADQEQERQSPTL